MPVTLKGVLSVYAWVPDFGVNECTDFFVCTPNDWIVQYKLSRLTHFSLINRFLVLVLFYIYVYVHTYIHIYQFIPEWKINGLSLKLVSMGRCLWKISIRHLVIMYYMSYNTTTATTIYFRVFSLPVYYRENNLDTHAQSWDISLINQVIKFIWWIEFWKQIWFYLSFLSFWVSKKTRF